MRKIVSAEAAGVERFPCFTACGYAWNRGGGSHVFEDLGERSFFLIDFVLGSISAPWN